MTVLRAGFEKRNVFQGPEPLRSANIPPQSRVFPNFLSDAGFAPRVKRNLGKILLAPPLNWPGPFVCRGFVSVPLFCFGVFFFFFGLF